MSALSNMASWHREENLMNVVYQAIQLGLLPWDPRKITAYRTDQSSFGEVIFWFETDILPEYSFSVKEDIIYKDPEKIALDMAEEAFKFYRYRPALPVEDHIILGEE